VDTLRGRREKREAIKQRSKRREPSTGEAHADEIKTNYEKTMNTDTHTHTQGPWCIHRAYANAQTMTVAEDNGESWDFTHTYIAQGEKIIAQVQQQSKSHGWPAVQNVNEMWANARLIAAAPSMQAALESLAIGLSPASLDIQRDNLADLCRVCHEIVESAIAKAKGGDA